MSLADIASNVSEIREAYEENFMGDRCNIWRYTEYGTDNDGADFDHGAAPAYTDVPCRLVQPKGKKLEEGGLVDLMGNLVLPVSYEGQITSNDRIELTTLQTVVLSESLMLSIQEAPRPTATGLACAVSLITGEASNE